MSTAKSWDLTWAANILECVPNVDVHGFKVSAAKDVRLTCEGTESRPAVVLEIEPAGLAAAQLIADALYLTEGPRGYVADAIGLLARHDWSGRVPAGADETTVIVKMTTTERIWTVSEAAA
jgi:hypothetical protein